MLGFILNHTFLIHTKQAEIGYCDMEQRRIFFFLFEGGRRRDRKRPRLGECHLDFFLSGNVLPLISISDIFHVFSTKALEGSCGNSASDL